MRGGPGTGKSVIALNLLASALEVAKAEVDSWGYDVVLAIREATRYVQLKTSVPVELNARLIEKPGACIIATIPKIDKSGVKLSYRIWEVPKVPSARRKLAPAYRKVYRRSSTTRDIRRGGHVVSVGEFSPKLGAVDLLDILFPR